MNEFRGQSFEQRSVVHENVERKELSDLQFADLEWSTERIGDFPAEVASHEIIHQGVRGVLEVSRIDGEGDDDGVLIHSRNTTISLVGKRESFTLQCTMDAPVHKATGYRTTTAVRKDRDVGGAREFPRGTGMVLYGKMLEYIQSEVNASGKPTRHDVSAEPNISLEDPLSIEKWLAIFGPVLKKHGYVRTDMLSWEKWYRPQQQIAAK